MAFLALPEIAAAAEAAAPEITAGAEAAAPKIAKLLGKEGTTELENFSKQALQQTLQQTLQQHKKSDVPESNNEPTKPNNEPMIPQMQEKLNNETELNEPQVQEKPGPNIGKIVGAIFTILVIVAIGLALWAFISPSSMTEAIGSGITGIMTGMIGGMASITSSGVSSLTDATIQVGGSVISSGAKLGKAMKLDDAGKGLGDQTKKGISAIKKIKKPKIKNPF